MRSKSSSRPCRSPVPKGKSQHWRNWNPIWLNWSLIYCAEDVSNSLMVWKQNSEFLHLNDRVFIVLVTGILDFNEMQICRRGQPGKRSQVPDQCANKQDLLSWSAAIKIQSTLFYDTFTDMSDHLISKQVIYSGAECAVRCTTNSIRAARDWNVLTLLFSFARVY